MIVTRSSILEQIQKCIEADYDLLSHPYESVGRDWSDSEKEKLLEALTVLNRFSEQVRADIATLGETR